MITQIPELIVIGYTSRPRPNAMQLLKVPDPPKSYTGQKAADWVAAKRLELSALALRGKLTGSIADVIAVNVTRGAEGSLLDTRNVPPGKNRSVIFMRWLLNQGVTFPIYPRDTDRRPVAIYGFDAKEFVRVAGTEARLAKMKVPIGFWYLNEECFDPYDMLVEAKRRDSLPLDSVCQLAGIECRADYETHQDVQEDARLAVELAARFTLYPFDSKVEKTLTAILDDHLRAPVEAVVAVEEAAEPEEEAELEKAAEPEEEEAGEEAEEEAEEEEESEYEEEDEDEDEDEDFEYDAAHEEEEEEEEEEIPPEPEPKPRRKLVKRPRTRGPK